MGEILGTLIKTFKASFLPFFDELASYLTPMWVSSTTNCPSLCAKAFFFFNRHTRNKIYKYERVKYKKAEIKAHQSTQNLIRVPSLYSLVVTRSSGTCTVNMEYGKMKRVYEVIKEL